jgi:hypothetical protein
MILRRISEGIRKQDWFVVTVEIITVVVGIFIGLQVDDWNQTRKDMADEKNFLGRIHEELLTSLDVRGFIRDQRLEDWEILPHLLFDIFEDPERESLTERECLAIQRSSILTANLAEMPSFSALLATGRMSIIRDEALKTALIRFEQHRQTLQNFTRTQGIDLGSKYPNLLKLTPLREDNGNIEPKVMCNLNSLRADQGFLNDFHINVDIFESYITSGLNPIVKSIEPLHLLLDKNLNLNH